MKALIRKDFIALWRYLKGYLLICVGFHLISMMKGDFDFLRFYPLLLVATIPNTLIAYDERDKWDKLCLTLPISRKQLVTSKYLMGILLLAGIFALSFVTSLVRELGQGTFDPFAFWLGLSVNMLFGLPIMCIVLPATFRLGAEKGRLIYGITFGVLAALVMGGGLLLAFMGLDETALDWWVSIVILAIIVLMLPVSWLLSVRFYEKREF